MKKKYSITNTGCRNEVHLSLFTSIRDAINSFLTLPSTCSCSATAQFRFHSLVFPYAYAQLHVYTWMKSRCFSHCFLSSCPVFRCICVLHFIYLSCVCLFFSSLSRELPQLTVRRILLATVWSVNSPSFPLLSLSHQALCFCLTVSALSFKDRSLDSMDRLHSHTYMWKIYFLFIYDTHLILTATKLKWMDTRRR